ncbi:MAG: hypothetical protein K0B87_07915 [Candidatus Syntrophosphaera sp.]|nr:hypothetical protein [Candidatus Syntrophosphaera sp.]
MNDDNNRLYKDLAWLWQLWGDPATEYAAYCDFLVPRMRRHARRELKTLLNVGCGGGKNLFTLRKHFQAAGLDAVAHSVMEPCLRSAAPIYA